MANLPNNMPATFDTDATWSSIQTLQARPFGIRVTKFSLVASAITTAGTVTVTDPNSGAILLGPMLVPAGIAAGTILFYDNPTTALTWPNFTMNGLTATGTRLLIWYRV